MWNRFRLVPRLGRHGVDADTWRRLALALRLEVLGLVLVLGVTSVFTLQNPSASAATAPAAGATPVTAVLGTGQLTGRFGPGTVGVNVITFEIADAGGNPIIPLNLPQVSVAEPSLSLGPLTATVQPGPTPGSYRAEVSIPAAGQWQVTAAVRVSRARAARGHHHRRRRGLRPALRTAAPGRGAVRCGVDGIRPGGAPRASSR